MKTLLIGDMKMIDKELKEKLNARYEKLFYEHMIESVDQLSLKEKLYLIDYLASSIVTEIDKTL